MAGCHYNAFAAYIPTMGVTPKELRALEANTRDQTKISNRLKRLQNSMMCRVNKPTMEPTMTETPSTTAEPNNTLIALEATNEQSGKDETG